MQILMYRATTGLGWNSTERRCSRRFTRRRRLLLCVSQQRGV